MAIPSFKLNNGTSIPSVGLGCWLGTPAQEKENIATVQMVTTALKLGYRHFDTASGYANEEAVGKAIRAFPIDRQDLFVTTKLTQADHGRAKEAFETSLKKMDIEYIDLYLVHWPQANDPETKKALPRSSSPTFEECWAEMEKLLEGGRCKSIGVSNFSVKNLEALLKKAKVVPAVNQVEVHPYLPQEELLDFCKSKGIHVTAYSPLGQYNSPLLLDETVLSIASAHNATAAQVLLTWNVTRGISVVPKSANEGRLKTNKELLPLTEKELATLSALHTEPGKYKSLVGYGGGGLSVPGSIYGWTLEDMGWDPKAFASKPGW